MGYDRGKIDIEEITGGVVNFDGAQVISPKSASKAAYGAGSNNTAIFTFTLTGTNATNAQSVDFFDQPVSGNN
ncbi:MAG: spore germination protein [Bacillota bacterium]|nr:spore germination protein [Bacillota bacterium]